jgi:hypothetical protein
MKRIVLVLVVSAMMICCLGAATLAHASAADESAHGQEAQIAKASESSLHLNLATEDTRQTKIKVEIKTIETPSKVIKRLKGVLPGPAEMALSGVPDGNYLVFFFAPGYAGQWQPLTVKQGKAEPEEITAKLFRKRYVVLRYAFNTSGGRELSGKGVTEGRAAVAHWEGLPYFQQDWQIWQQSSDEDMFGDTPFLDFHRFSDGFGFAKGPKGIAFEDLKEAPAETEYKCECMKAEKGLTLFCRVEADRKDGLGYGKVVVEDVTETPPAGVKVIDSP